MLNSSHGLKLKISEGRTFRCEVEQLSSDSGALGVVGWGLQGPSPACLSGEVEAVLSHWASRTQKMAEQDHNPPQETESGADPSSVQGEAKRHQTPIFVSPNWEPDG